jgi:hypothetical protein
VFLYCRAAATHYQAPSRKIFTSLTDPDEARLLDDLTRRAGQFLHRVRHVAADDEHGAQFPVDHHDARFALNLTKLLIAHIGRVLATS